MRRLADCEEQDAAAGTFAGSRRSFAIERRIQSRVVENGD